MLRSIGNQFRKPVQLTALSSRFCTKSKFDTRKFMRFLGEYFSIFLGKFILKSWLLIFIAGVQVKCFDCLRLCPKHFKYVLIFRNKWCEANWNSAVGGNQTRRQQGVCCQNDRLKIQLVSVQQLAKNIRNKRSNWFIQFQYESQGYSQS